MSNGCLHKPVVHCSFLFKKVSLTAHGGPRGVEAVFDDIRALVKKSVGNR